ncbi:MAG: glycogen debranching protein [Candidatus Rokuibacteriota bacterium]|nr:MAG: glycogen debranching protein [Candidatus Rokubacteria bacterium]
MVLTWGRAVTGDLRAAERREWLCVNGIGGFASGTIAGTPTRRYHALLVAALKPPLGRTVMAAGVHETVEYAGAEWPLFAARWVSGIVDPHGYRLIERFRLDGTTPVWTYACADALVEKCVWMEHGANTTHIRWRVLRAREPLTLRVKTLVNYRDYHATTRAGDWRMDVARVADGLRVIAFDGARPLLLLAPGADADGAHTWFRDFDLPRERERGLDHVDDELHAGTFRATLAPGAALTLTLSAEAAPAPDGDAAWQRRIEHESDVLARWTRAQPNADTAPEWMRRLVLAADQFLVRRPLPDDPDGATVIAGYHWFGDWGRDTMIALPGLTLATGRTDVARKILMTFARFVDRGLLPNRFPDDGQAPEYNTVDATLWYFQAIRAYHAATGDDGLLKDLYPTLESILAWHRQGTRYSIRQDPADGLLAAGEPGVQLTWMDAKVGDRVVTPRTGKPVEINALWYNALVAMTDFARRLRRPASDLDADAARVAEGFERFWNARDGWCYDVLDGADGHDATLRPNQIFAVSLPATPLSPERRRAVVDACARHLVTSYGLRSLAPFDPRFVARYGGDQGARDGAYHQGAVWGWLLGPFALAHFAAYGDADTARSFLTPMADHLTDHGLGSIAEIFDGEPPFAPNGCIAQAWSVAETLRAWHVLGATAAPSRRPRVS